MLSAQRQNDQYDRFMLPDTALNRVLAEAPYLSRCSDNKTATRIRPREYAINYPYMQINRAGFVSWLIFDLDHANAYAWQDAGLPAPNLIVQNRNSGHSHLYYAIPPVCTGENGRSKPIQYMKAIYRAFASKLNADIDFHGGPVAKTPGHPWWRTSELHNHTYELSELADSVELEYLAPWQHKGPNLAAVSHSRHCIMFERLRFYAYSAVNQHRESGDYSAFTRALETFAYNSNSFRKLGFETDLSQASLRATIKSVARWTWDRYTGKSSVHRGSMNLSTTLPLETRQKLAAEHTHKTRKQKTEAKIRGACRILQSQGKALLQETIAQATKLTRQTIARYKHILIEVLKPTEVINLFSKAAPPRNVSYAAHQVSGPVLGHSGFLLPEICLLEGGPGEPLLDG